jgi:hypothetical protein
MHYMRSVLIYYAGFTEFKSQKASDIISTLVGMYDSREIIVIELQQWLAKRLLVAQDYDVDAEVGISLCLCFHDTGMHILSTDHGN